MEEMFGSQEFLKQVRYAELDKASAKIYSGRNGAASRVTELFKTKDLKEAVTAALTWGDEEIYLATLAKLATDSLEKTFPKEDEIEISEALGVALKERTELAASELVGESIGESFTRYRQVAKNNSFNTALSDDEVLSEILASVKDRITVADKASATLAKFPFLRPEA